MVDCKMRCLLLSHPLQYWLLESWNGEGSQEPGKGRGSEELEKEWAKVRCSTGIYRMSTLRRWSDLHIENLESILPPPLLLFHFAKVIHLHFPVSSEATKMWKMVFEENVLEISSMKEKKKKEYRNDDCYRIWAAVVQQCYLTWS